MSACNPSNETPSARSRRIGGAKGAFDALRCDFPPHTDAIEEMLEVMHAGARLAQGRPRGGGFLVAPIGVGKSEVCKAVEAAANEDAPPGGRHALRIEVDSNGKSDSIPRAVLHRLGARRPDAGNEANQWSRAAEEMERVGLGLLIVDEFNRAARRPTMSAAIAIGIQQHFMDPGICPVVFAGSEQAGTVLRGAPAVHERLDDVIDLQPLVWGRAEDEELMTDFLADLDGLIVKACLLPDPSGLGEGDLPEHICTVTRGKLRAIVKTIRFGLGLALREGSPRITREHLALGVRHYCMRQKLTKTNPLDASVGVTTGRTR